MLPSSDRFDALLDSYGRFMRALMVLHYECDSTLDFDAWVELADMRYTPLSRALDTPVKTFRQCPEEGCLGEYKTDGVPYAAGKDHTGAVVMFQRWVCTGKPGHFHTMEVRNDGEARTS